MHKRNRHLVDNSSVCVCYLTEDMGGYCIYGKLCEIKVRNDFECCKKIKNANAYSTCVERSFRRVFSLTITKFRPIYCIIVHDVVGFVKMSNEKSVFLSIFRFFAFRRLFETVHRTLSKAFLQSHYPSANNTKGN